MEKQIKKWGEGEKGESLLDFLPFQQTQKVGKERKNLLTYIEIREMSGAKKKNPPQKIENELCTVRLSN